MLDWLKDERVEAYVEVFSRQLRRMPQVERADRQIELRQHLEELITAHLEIGEEAANAVDLSMSKMGPPRRIGRNMQLEWVMAQQEVNPLFPAIYTFMCFALMVTSAMCVMLFLVVVSVLFNLWQTFDPTACVPLILGLEISGSLIFGWMVSRRIGKVSTLAIPILGAVTTAFMVAVSVSDGNPGHATVISVLTTGVSLSVLAVAAAWISGNCLPKRNRLLLP